MIILAADPDCPIMLKAPANHEGTSKNRLAGYTIKNVSNSNIKTFLVQEVSWFGNGGYRNLYEIKQDEVFGPGMIFSTTEGDESRFVSFNKNSYENGEAKTDRAYKRVWVAIVTSVVLSDGTKYDASSNLRSLEQFIDCLNVTTKMSDSEAKAKESKLTEFVETKLFRSQ